MEERYREQFRALENGPEGEAWEFSYVHDDGTILLVEVDGPRQVNLRWRAPVAYRVIDEGVRIRQKPLLEGKELNLVFEVDDSVYLEELTRLSNEVLAGQALKHYVVWTLNQCVDVVAATAPEIT